MKKNENKVKKKGREVRESKKHNEEFLINRKKV